MKEYIEREKALQELRLNHKDVIYIDKQETASRIRKIPSADVVEVVRCKDCKHYKGLAECELKLCESMGTYWYCACGERRSDE